MTDPTPMTSSAAAELLRSYAPAGVSLDVALRAARSATTPAAISARQTGKTQIIAARRRVDEAARTLGLTS